MAGKRIFKQNIVLAAAVVKRGKILLIQRSRHEEVYPGLWELPSGKKEAGEKTLAALAREVREETNLIITMAVPFAVFDYKIKKQQPVVYTTQINFIAQPRGKIKVRLSPDHQDWAWVSQKEAGKYKISRETRAVIAKAFKFFTLLKRNLNSRLFISK